MLQFNQNYSKGWCCTLTIWTTNNGVYVPTQPYVIQSGKRQGKSLELLMFKNYRFLSWWKKELDKKSLAGNKNALHRHLNWLILRGENRKTKIICQFCDLNIVTRFSVRYSSYDGQSSFGAGFSSCDNPDCIEKLENYAHKSVTFMPFRFSSILLFPVKADQKLVARMFRQIFGLTGKLTKEKAFEFFVE